MSMSHIDRTFLGSSQPTVIVSETGQNFWCFQVYLGSIKILCGKRVTQLFWMKPRLWTWLQGHFLSSAAPVYFSSSHIKMKGPTIQRPHPPHTPVIMPLGSVQRTKGFLPLVWRSSYWGEGGWALEGGSPRTAASARAPHRPEGQNPSYLPNFDLRYVLDICNTSEACNWNLK